MKLNYIPLLAVIGILPFISGCNENKSKIPPLPEGQSYNSVNDVQEREEIANKAEEERLAAERIENERREAERIENERREAEKREREEQERKEAEKLAKQGPEWLQGNWTLEITGPNGILISTYNLSINGLNARLTEGGNLKYDGEFSIDGNRLKVGPRTYVINEYSKTLEYSGMYSFRKAGGSSSGGSGSSSFNSPSSVLSYLSGRTFYNNGDALRISSNAIYVNGNAVTGAPRVQSFNGTRATIVANSPYSGGSAIYLYVDASNNTVTQNGDVYRAR